jgi:hypothetical protein
MLWPNFIKNWAINKQKIVWNWRQLPSKPWIYYTLEAPAASIIRVPWRWRQHLTRKSVSTCKTKTCHNPDDNKGFLSKLHFVTSGRHEDRITATLVDWGLLKIFDPRTLRHYHTIPRNVGYNPSTDTASQPKRTVPCEKLKCLNPGAVLNPFLEIQKVLRLVFMRDGEICTCLSLK